jgi:hypothetical protein
MPRLSIATEALPSRAFAGELLRVPVTITNIGRLPARALRLAVGAGAGVALAGGRGAAAVAGASPGAGAAGMLRPGGAAGDLTLGLIGLGRGWWHGAGGCS